MSLGACPATGETQGSRKVRYASSGEETGDADSELYSVYEVVLCVKQPGDGGMLCLNSIECVVVQLCT